MYDDPQFKPNRSVESSPKALKQYPQPEGFDSSASRVTYRYYKSEQVALVAADIARSNAEVLEDRGYDFGMSVPGYIDTINTGKHAGKFRVTCPN